MMQFRQMEIVTRSAPLGIRFRDIASGNFNIQDLVVTTRFADGKSARLAANYSGVYVLHESPQLRDWIQRPAKSLWDAPLPVEPLVVEVRDPLLRYIDFQLNVTAPSRGLFEMPDSPADGVPGVPLFPGVLYTPPAGMTGLRAHLQDRNTDQPAKWAVLEALFGGRVIGRGVADASGRVQTVIAYPPPRPAGLSSPGGSPPTGSVRPLQLREWMLQFRLFYNPVLPSPPEDLVEGALPELSEVLNQAPGHIWADEEATVLFPGAALQFGRELVLRSPIQSLSSPVRPERPSLLFVTPATSPI